jgi:hypothetical protein
LGRFTLISTKSLYCTLRTIRVTINKEEAGMTETPKLTFRKELLHVEQPAGTVELTEELIQRYGAATGHPIQEPKPGERMEAPIAMLNVFFSRDVEAGAEVKLEGATVGLNAGRAIELYEKAYAGDVLTRSAVLQDVYTKTGRSGTMAFEVWEILFRNQQGTLVARARDSMVYRAPGAVPPKEGADGNA